ncbi:MAG: diacylglycerol/lipid kinase family protein, partial [Nocardioides sp.]|uniref:diacylglycerol/lipid kinase family protein n=1 Tax=Nocardioides sp. TaxID=35761 RepID=UPI003F0C850E
MNDQQPAARRIALLTNPTAGKGRGASYGEQAARRLADAGFEVVAVSGADAHDAVARSRTAVAGGCEALVVCGGDGTVHLGL